MKTKTNLLIVLLGLGMAATARPAALIVSTLNDSGPGSLRQAILDASTGDTVSFGVAGTITLAGGELQIDKDLTVRSENPMSITISGRDGTRVFNIAGGNVLLDGLNISNGRPDGLGCNGDGCYGGAIVNHGALVLTNCVLSRNATSGSFGTNGLGGAVFNAGALSIDGCLFSYNHVTDGAGGALFNSDSATLMIKRSTFINNAAGGRNSSLGGAIYNAGDFTLSESIVSSNSAGIGMGGTIVVNIGTMTVSGCTFSGNRGVGICHLGFGPAHIGSCLISENSGGGIHNDAVQSPLIVSNCTVRANTNFEGGGINSRGPLVVINSTISSNRAANGFGGGIVHYIGELKMTNSCISGNTATSGGGIANSGLLTISASTISGNSSTGDGGGIYWVNATVNLVGSTIAFNRAGARGGGLYFGFRANIRDSLIAGNTVPPGGAGPDCIGRITSQGYNLIQNTNGLTGLTTSDLYNRDPKLGPLQDNGGPTWTHALLPGSPAIDAGFGIGLATDQRGHVRATNIPTIPNAAGSDGSDIGAFEVGNFIASIEKSGADVRISFLTTSNETYRLEYVDALGSANWTDLGRGFPGSGGIVCATNVGAATESHRFYRVRQAQ